MPFAHPQQGTVGGMGHGLMSATEPWSGHYRIQPTLYAVAHTTQFTHPKRCKYVNKEAAGVAGGGWVDAANVSSIVVFSCDEGKDWTAVIETTSATTAFDGPTQFHLRNVPSGAASKPLSVWETCENSSFVKKAAPSVSGGTFELQLTKQCITTVTTMTDGAPVPEHTIPASAHMSLDYTDSFDSYPEETPVKYFADEGGSFAAEKHGGNGVLAQQVTQKPIHGAWWNDGEPWTVMGDSQTWTDYSVSVKAMIGGPAPPPAPGPAPLPSDAVQITQMSAKSPSHGQCLNVEAASNRDGTPIFTYACGQAAQPLEFVAARSGLHNANDEWETGGGTLKSLGKCATAMPDGSVALYTCNGTAAQHWTMDWPAIKSGSGCLGLGGPSPSFPSNKLAKVSACAASDVTQEWKNSSTGSLGVTPAPEFVRVCGRISAFKPDGTPPQGYCLIVDGNSSWFLAAGGKKGANGRDAPIVLATGKLPSRSLKGKEGAWRTLTLEMKGSTITPMVDGAALGATVDTEGRFEHGMAAVGSGWHLAYFDDFALKPVS